MTELPPRVRAQIDAALRRKQRKAEARAEQARQVAGWVQWVDDARDPVGRALDRALPGDACIMHNSSPLPVYDVLLSYWLLGESDARTGSQQVGVLPPGEKVVGIRRDVLARWYESREVFTALSVEVRFTDSTGRRWWRDHRGVLTDKGPWTPDRGIEKVDGAPAG